MILEFLPVLGVVTAIAVSAGWPLHMVMRETKQWRQEQAAQAQRDQEAAWEEWVALLEAQRPRES